MKQNRKSNKNSIDVKYTNIYQSATDTKESGLMMNECFACLTPNTTTVSRCRPQDGTGFLARMNHTRDRERCSLAIKHSKNAESNPIASSPKRSRKRGIMKRSRALQASRISEEAAPRKQNSSSSSFRSTSMRQPRPDRTWQT